jgi:hypothetical protein
MTWTDPLSEALKLAEILEGHYPPGPARHVLLKAAALLTTQASEIERLRGEREPAEPGGFEGDIFFGDPQHPTRGTHRWRNGAWERLPDEAVVLAELLAQASTERDTWRKTAERMVEEPNALADALARASTAEAERDASKAVWDWLAERTGLELSWYAEPEEDPEWQVHRVTGGVNDREWELVGTGATPLLAFEDARTTLAAQQDQKGEARDADVR